MVAHDDLFRNIPLVEYPYQLPRIKPHIQFNIAGFTMDKVRPVVKKAQAGFTPGPSGTSYKIYKNYPQLKSLYKPLHTLWKKRKELNLWTLAEGCFVPKGKMSVGIEAFQENSLLDGEGEIFWSTVAKRLTSYLFNNEYIDLSAQKAGVRVF